MAKSKQNPHSKDRYYAVAARGVIYGYEMADDVLFWGVLLGIVLAICTVPVILRAWENWVPFILWGFVFLEFFLVFFLIIHHAIWRHRLRRSDKFAVLYDITSREFVFYPLGLKEVRIPGKAVTSIRPSFNYLFNPISSLFNLKERHLGNFVVEYLDADGETSKFVVRGVDKPEIALLRVDVVKEKFLSKDAEEIKVREDGDIQVEGEESISSDIMVEGEDEANSDVTSESKE